ncbi:golgin subfamily A member 4 isoform X1 [Dendroctonus ponderosae]|uniref:golgin subfamily A member 4 isoform X1 n=1 Tax=Dendroctonus ponderosae TaxID=77166 RepID=UPI002034C3F3|nr:golgin subfamily A member 4 isoform X1 [Dendroctonus ponderosae]KAH1018632.1 hypothetical protein HUJ05_006361 [Dendroctonus ponderosae]
MFKKLKEKITEEVKSSPQRFQQLTQSVSDKLQGTSAPEENMFSIGEDADENASAMRTDQGFSSVNLVSPSSEGRSRRLSNSSMASDVSFLPRYEPSSSYHLQSDLDASASELEDNVSQASSQLGHVSKEQVYAAYQKSQMRYHKYRGRYTDLARHYKELERENAKMKSVLGETQDKAIRRVTELKEQCTLEQKAKAHLESALRDELDERQMKIQSLQTKIELLQQEQNYTDGLVEVDQKETAIGIDSDKLEQLTKYLNDARSEIEALNSKIQEHKASAIIFQTKEQEYRNKISSLEQDILNFSEREKENNIKLAENKMELHNELISKDSEISRLKNEIESLKTAINAPDKEYKSAKVENLQSQNIKLTDKLEGFTQKCNELETKLRELEKYQSENKELTEKNAELNQRISAAENKAEARLKNVLDENMQLQTVIDALKLGLNTCQDNLKRITEEKQNLIDLVQNEKLNYENQIQHLRDSAKKGLFSLETRISDRVKQQFEEKEAMLKSQFDQKLKEISASNQTAAEIHLQLLEKDAVITDISKEIAFHKDKLTEKSNQYKELESNHLELIEESSHLRAMLSNLERQISETANENNMNYEENIGRLQNTIKSQQEQLEHLETMCTEKEDLIVKLTKDNVKLEASNSELYTKFKLLIEKEEASGMEVTENNLMELKVQALEEEKRVLLDSFEMERKLYNKVFEEHNDIKVKEIEISELEERNNKLDENIVRLKGFLNDKEHTIVELNKIKLGLEQELTKAQELTRIKEERNEVVELDKTECNLLQIKVQQLQNEKENLLKSMNANYFQTSNENMSPNYKEDIMDENVELAKENLQLKQVKDELMGKVRIIEERDQVVEMESSECNLLKLKLQELEKEKKELEKSFEMERQLFNKVLVEHKELKVKEELITDLEGSNVHLSEKIAKLKHYLKEKEETIVKLQKANLELEQEITKLKESRQIRDEQIDSVQIEKTECDLLEMKLKSLQEENQNMLNSFEMERTTYESALTKGTHLENQIDDLNKQILQLKQDKESLEDSYRIEKDDLMQSFELERKNFELIDTELRRMSQENHTLKDDKENLNSKLKEETLLLEKQINVLKEETEKLQSDNENLKKEIDVRQKKLENLSKTVTQLNKDLEHKEDKYKTMLETLNTEKSEKKAAITKLKAIQAELDKSNAEIGEIKKSLETVDKLYNAAKSKQSDDGHLLEETRRKLTETRNDKIKLDKELKKKTDEFHFKAKEMNVIEQQFNLATRDNKQLRDKIDEITAECNNLRPLLPKLKELEQVKKQNETLQKECDKQRQDISELKVRISQLSSDNRNVNEDHDKLAAEIEEYKLKCESLQNEKGTVEGKYTELERERDSLRVAVTDLTDKLEQNRRQIENHSSSAPATNNPDLMEIQKDFFDLKQKFDQLHSENNSMKAEYSKLEEQCRDFTKSKKDLETQISELERHYTEVLHEKQLLQDEILELKIAPINRSSSKLDKLAIVQQEKSVLSAGNRSGIPDDQLLKENETLKDKLIQYKSLDITNKSSIEFYENELEKVKNQNEKLNRKLDETLVTLNHCADLSSSTEIEYLKNVLYNYMLGKESMVLARVIAAVCKFDPNQTEAVLQKEQQKQTIFGQLGIL